MENKKGFTLAEVLITLTIIGIVAALTIPTLINNVNEAGYTSACKNTFSLLSNAVSMAASNNQGMLHTGPNFTTAENFRNDFCNILGCTKLTNSSETAPLINNQLDYKDSTDTSYNGMIGYVEPIASGLVGAYLNNGSYLAFMSYSDCTGGGDYVPGNPGYSTNICADIVVDINGTQGPNMSGEDTFFFHVAQDNNGAYSIIPWGFPDDVASYGIIGSSDCVAGGAGMTCAYQRLYGSMP